MSTAAKMATETDLDRLSINTIRTLSLDAVQKANSGHPGLPLGMAPAAYVLSTNASKKSTVAFKRWSRQFLFLFLIFVVGGMLSGVTAQDSSKPCRILKIDTPDPTFPWNPVRVSITPENIEGSQAPQFDWTVIKENFDSKRVEIEKIVGPPSIRVRAWDANEGGLLSFFVTAKVGDCNAVGFANLTVVPNPGTPLLIDEFGNLSHNDERGRLDAALSYMSERPKHELVIFATFDARVTSRGRKLRLSRFLDHLVVKRGFDAKRITIAVDSGQGTRFRLQSIPADLIAIYEFPGSLFIRAEQFTEFEKLFR